MHDAIKPLLYSGCRYCEEALAEMKAEGTDVRVYGTRVQATGQFVEGYVLRPDRNSSGVITSWHLSRK